MPPAGLKVCIVADRGFGDQKPYKMLAEELCVEPLNTSFAFAANLPADRSPPAGRGFRR